MFSIFIGRIKIFFIKLFLAMTSLAPMVVIYGLSRLEADWSVIHFIHFILCLLLFILMVVGCWAILNYFEKKSRKHFIHIKEIERKDHDVLVYLFIFLLPFIRSDSSIIGSQPITTVVCILIILIVIADVGAYNFNPILRLLQYHIYSISTRNAKGILIAATEDVLYGNNIELKVVTLSHNYKIYMHTRRMNV